MENKEINLAIIGVGNCASSLVQGITFYSNRSNAEGLIRDNICGYRAQNIKLVGAIDVDSKKIGKDLSEAIFTAPNLATKFSEVPTLGVPVVKGPVLDGVADHMTGRFTVDDNQESVDVAAYLKEVKAEVVICYLPVGSEKAAKFYAQAALEAGVSFLNAIPVFICSTDEWHQKFYDAGIPIAGDDIKSQFGATYLNRILVENLKSRGFKVDDLYQLNVGGNTDFENMIDEQRLTSKRVSKTSAVTSLYTEEEKTPALRIGPSDYVAHLKDNKICYINVNGTQFGDVPFELELKLKVEDSPNSAGIMMDAVRMLKVARDRGLRGNIKEISSFGFKHPMHKYGEDEITKMLNKYLQTAEVHQEG